jgi:hypothetical protein
MVDASPHGALRAALQAESHYGPYRLVLELGRDLMPREPPPGTPQGEYMNCFHSAFALAHGRRLRYCEGWATTPTAASWLSRPHAWCIDDDDQVIDPSFVDRTYDVWAYRGVVVPLDIASPHVARGSRGTLVAYETTLPLLWQRSFRSTGAPHRSRSRERLVDQQIEPSVEEAEGAHLVVVLTKGDKVPQILVVERDEAARQRAADRARMSALRGGAGSARGVLP